MTTLSTLTLRMLGTDRAVVTPTVLSMMHAPRSGYAQVIQYRPRGVQYTTRVTLPWCTTREGARYTAEVATHYLMRSPLIVPATQDMGTPLERGPAPALIPLTVGAVLTHKMRGRSAPGSPPAQRPPRR